MIILESSQNFKTILAATGLFLLGWTTAAHANFTKDPNPSNKIQVKLTDVKKKYATYTDTGTVINSNDIGISIDSPSSFASGVATIKPETNALLTTLTFTPVDPNAFGGFSFRGQDLVANQSITATVQDNQGHGPQMFTFIEGVANQDFTRDGITSVDDETIKWVKIYNSGGFKESKQFAFSRASKMGAVPEPKSWAMMLVGFGAIGLALRRRQNRHLAAA